MSERVIVTKRKLDSLAEAIGSKSGTDVPLTIDGMADAVLGMELGIEPTGTKSITTNGTHDVAEYESAEVNVQPRLQYLNATPQTVETVLFPSSGYDGFSSVTLEAAPLEDVMVEPSTNGETITPGTGYYGIGAVTVFPPSLQTKQVTPGRNTTIVDPDASYVGLSRVYIDGVASTLQNKSATSLVGGSPINVSADSGYNGLNVVTVNPVPYSLDANSLGITATIG